MDSIIRNPGICGGAPTIKGRRLTVFDIVSSIQVNDEYKNYSTEFELSLSAIKSAIIYCSIRQCVAEKTIKNTYCDGCILRVDEEDLSYIDNAEEILLNDGTKITRFDGGIFYGSKEAFIQEEYGKAGWEIAKDLIFRFPELME